MPETWPARIVFLTGLSLVAMMLWLAQQGHRKGATAQPGVVGAQSSLAADSATQPENRPEPARGAQVRIVRGSGSPPPPPSATPVRLVVTAARGDSWLAARAGSAAGKALYEGILKRGETVSLAAPRIWIRFGAAANLDLALNGKRLAEVPVGTLDVVLTPAGLRPA